MPAIVLRAFRALLLAAATALSCAAFAQDVAQPLPAECRDKGDPTWYRQEKFVWDRVCRGLEADFNVPEFGGDLDPASPKDWPPTRTLTSRFLETILLQDRYRQALTRRGVRIIGADFVDRLDLQNAVLAQDLWLNKSRLHTGADLSGLRTARLLSLQGSVVSSKSGRAGDDLDLEGAQIGGDLLLGDGARFNAIKLAGATIGGELNLDRSHVLGEFDGEGLAVRSLSLDKARFDADVDLARASIKDDLSVSNGTTFAKSVDFTSARIDGDLSLGGGRFNGKNEANESIDLTGARIAGDLELGGGVFAGSIDLTRAQIGGELSLTSFEPERHDAQWAAGAKLDLHDAKADKIPSVCEAWPPQVVLEGFTYRSVDPIPADDMCPEENKNAAHRAGGDKRRTALETWLAKFTSQSSQPYEQFAAVLQSQGDARNATLARYAGRDHELAYATGKQRFGLTVLKYFIGYGYYLELAFIPVGFLFIAGMLVMRLSGEDARNNLPRWGAVYSFDMLLPVVRLRDSNYTVDLKGWAQYYFYLHKIMGYVLASVLIAAVAGLSK